METLTYLFLFLLFRFSAQEQINCEENKMHAVYYATQCCFVTLVKDDLEFNKCHYKYAKMANQPAEKLKSPERIAINICAHECSLLEKGFIREEYRHEFDPDAIEDYYLEKYPQLPLFSTYMLDSFKKCLLFDSVGEVNIKYPNVTFLQNVKCDPLAARIMMCVRTKAMQTCPPSAWDVQSLDCAASKLYFKECVGSIEKVVRTMD